MQQAQLGALVQTSGIQEGFESPAATILLWWWNGRHGGLKIRFLRGVWVRFPPGALFKEEKKMKNVMLCFALFAAACGDKEEDTATDVVVEEVQADTGQPEDAT